VLLRRYQNVKLAQLLTFTFVVPVGFLSLCTIAARQGYVRESWFIFAAALIFLSLAQTVWTCNFVLLNHACPSKNAMGSVNGLAQMLSAATRALAPASASIFFALSVDRGCAGGQLVFILLLGVAVGGTCAAHSLNDVAEPEQEGLIKL
jgi:hypothetical protein